MTRGRGRGSVGRISKSSAKGNSATHRNIPTIPIPTIPHQQGGTSSSSRPSHINQVQTLGPSSTPPILTSGNSSTPPVYVEPSLMTPNQSNRVDEGISHNNAIGEGISTQSNAIGEGVPKEIKEFYFGEFKKAFYWDSLIDREVKRLWGSKAARRYCDFMCNIKKEKDIVQPDFVPKDVWDNWMELWKDPKCVKKSAKNRCGGGTAVAIGTHTGGSVTIGEHRKTCKYILRKG